MEKRYILKLKGINAYAKLTRLDLDLFRVEPYTNPFVSQQYKTLEEALNIAKLINSEEGFYKFYSDYEIEKVALVVFESKIVESFNIQ